MSLRKKVNIGVVIIIGIFMMLHTFITNEINRNVESILRVIPVVNEADSNIVIIKIDERDIEQLGGWPLKRSYYALLISALRNHNVRCIGFEVFLSDALSSQAIYNDLLTAEIRKTENIVLGSIAKYSKKTDTCFEADSILYPVHARDKDLISTGHLHFLENDGYYVPPVICKDSLKEYSFTHQLSKILLDEPITQALAKVNLFTSWQKYLSYSLLEFLQENEINPDEFNHLEDKIILVGVSDPLIAKFLESPFDDRLPGIGFHALMLDNILNNYTLAYGFYDVSSILLVVLVVLMIFFPFSGNRTTLYGVMLAVFLVLSAFLFIIFRLELNYAAFVVPIVALVISDMGFSFYENRYKLEHSIHEATALRNTLLRKEEQLAKLQSELDLSPESDQQDLLNRLSQLKAEIEALKNKALDEEVTETAFSSTDTNDFLGIIYKSNKMKEVISLITKVAKNNVTVLILGESGSGKELVAKAIHTISQRNGKPYLAVNCAALTETLLESELFGHVKGAFTGAVADKKGIFESGDTGTVFLDEIGEISPNFQAKLLRVLQSGEFERVGSTETMKVDVRVIAATNKNPEKMVAENKFREDLYYRLNVFPIQLPPLRDRREDIAPLAEHFAKREDPDLTLSKAVLYHLEENNWKGNVRELESTIKRAAIFTKSDKRTTIKISDLPSELVNNKTLPLDEMILHSLREKSFSHSSITETAKELGDLTRTVVSENFRGIVFQMLHQQKYDLDKTFKEVAQSDDEKVLKKVEKKVHTYFSNVKKDVEKSLSNDFNTVKAGMSSKYKNLPQKFHFYLDELISYLIKKPEEQ